MMPVLSLLVLCLTSSAAIASAAPTTAPAPALRAGDVVPAERLPPREKVHVYLLMGQSNMAGRGKVTDADRAAPAGPRILSLDKGGRRVVAADPLHWDKPSAGVGAGLAFARAALDAERDADVVIALVPCAVGGTPLARWEKGGDLFQSAVDRATIAARTGTLKGVLWHQAESDASEKGVPTYADRLARMIGDFRAAVGAERLPFAVGELGEFLVARNPRASAINDALRATAASVPAVACAASKGLTDGGDALHCATDAQREFGRRYAAAMRDLSTRPADGRE